MPKTVKGVGDVRVLATIGAGVMEHKVTYSPTTGLTCTCFKPPPGKPSWCTHIANLVKSGCDYHDDKYKKIHPRDLLIATKVVDISDSRLPHPDMHGKVIRIPLWFHLVPPTSPDEDPGISTLRWTVRGMKECSDPYSDSFTNGLGWQGITSAMGLRRTLKSLFLEDMYLFMNSDITPYGELECQDPEHGQFLHEFWVEQDIKRRNDPQLLIAWTYEFCRTFLAGVARSSPLYSAQCFACETHIRNNLDTDDLVPKV